CMPWPRPASETLLRGTAGPWQRALDVPPWSWPCPFWRPPSTPSLCLQSNVATAARRRRPAVAPRRQYVQRTVCDAVDGELGVAMALVEQLPRVFRRHPHGDVANGP